MVEAILGNVRASEAESREHDGAVGAKRVVTAPSNYTERFEYNADSTVLYVGFAVRGLAEGTDGWLLHKYTYNASMQPTKKEVAYGNWTNRASESYA